MNVADRRRYFLHDLLARFVFGCLHWPPVGLGLCPGAWCGYTSYPLRRVFLFFCVFVCLPVFPLRAVYAPCVTVNGLSSVCLACGKKRSADLAIHGYSR